MAEAAAEHGHHTKSGGVSLKGALKWTFRLAVVGIGIGLGSEIISEILVGGALHSKHPLAEEMFGYGQQLAMPFWDTLSEHLDGDTAAEKLSWVRNTFINIQEFFGYEHTFPEPELALEDYNSSDYVFGGDDFGGGRTQYDDVMDLIKGDSGLTDPRFNEPSL